MDVSILYNQHLLIFAVSSLADILICAALFVIVFKVCTAKNMAVENNREIYEHDKEIFDIKEKIDEIQKS